MFWEKKLTQWVQDIRDRANLPARLVLWDGQQHDFGTFAAPQVTLHVKSATALPYLLEPNMVYSCAYFENGDEDLATAQIKKIDHILTKIQLQPGQRLLDIGCGWGALVLRAAQKFCAKCVGVTLSQNQFDLATKRVKDAGLEGQIEIRLQDYRDVQGQFDRITSVGMFEHVGRKNLPGYFAKVRELLVDDGIAMNHGITSTDFNSGETALGGGEFIDRYVFPDGELPHIGLALEALQEGGLEAVDVESLRRHYARTLDI